MASAAMITQCTGAGVRPRVASTRSRNTSALATVSATAHSALPAASDDTERVCVPVPRRPRLSALAPMGAEHPGQARMLARCAPSVG